MLSEGSDTIEHMFALTASPAEVARRLAEIERADPDHGSTMTVTDRLAALADAESLAIWVDAVRTELLAALIPEDVDPPKLIAEVAFTLGVAETTVRIRAAAARELTGRLPAAMAAMHGGGLRWSHARVLADATAFLPDDPATEVERRVVPEAMGTSVAAFTRLVNRAVLDVDQPAAQAAHEFAVSSRRVRISAEPFGMATLWALLPAEGAAAVACGLRDLARPVGRRGNPDERTLDQPEPRTLDQREADALVQVFTDLSGDTTTATAARRTTRNRPAISVTVSAETLLGLDDAPAALHAGRLSGPITAGQARRIAADGVWRRLLTDPVSGALLDLGRERYRPTAQLRAFVVARDVRCTRPGCDQPSAVCDLDHALDWVRDGHTSVANLHCACGRCHSLKEVGWRVTRGDDGSTAWTSPRGVTRISRVPDLRPEDRHRRRHQDRHPRHPTTARPTTAELPNREFPDSEPPVFEPPDCEPPVFEPPEPPRPPGTHLDDQPPF